MSLPRIFLSRQLASGQITSISPDQAHHLITVLRLQPGNHIEVVDATGQLFLAALVGTDLDAATVRVLEPITRSQEPTLEVILVQGLPKADKMDWLVQKATELGVARIVPLATEHSVVNYTGNKAVAKVERWQRIAEAAAKQADRLKIPEIDPIRSLAQLVAEPQFWTGLHLLAWEGSQNPLKKILQATRPRPERIVIYIGPEGSFSHSEREILLAEGASDISLGPRILRTETAGLALLSMIMYEYDQLNL